MADRRIDIRDDEFRVIGQRRTPATSTLNETDRKRKVGWVALILVALLGGAIWLFWPKGPKPPEGVFDPISPESAAIAVKLEPLGSVVDSLHPAFVEKLDTTINDVVLSLYIPHDTDTPVLTVGAPDKETREAVMAFQAADIRADNREILGSFVLEGKMIARGTPKAGFCAIIDGKVTVGVAESTSLFEEAIEKDGYFFRQFSLVKNGVLEENAQVKNKTMRKALCDRNGQIFVAVSETDESMHDFAQALVDLGVDNAIYLVGSHSAFGWYRDEAGEQIYFGVDLHRQSYKNENYIIWK
jgi:hypothetical protein